jgi:SAM-dependent methyltransferase
MAHGPVRAIQRAAAVGFDLGAADYERGRPGYPPAAIDLVADRLGLGGGRGSIRIVDLAAGTGKLTRELTRLTDDVVAVEPVDGMREQLRRAVPNVEVVDATAEDLPFGDGTVDAVLVAQAFHWFDVEAAAPEIARVLRTHGGLAVLRNVWDESVAWTSEMQSLISAQRTHEPAHATSRWRERLEATGCFAPLQEEVVPHLVLGDRATLLARVSSISFIAMLGGDERRRLLQEIAALLDAHGVGLDGAPIEMPHRTHVVWARRA